MPVSSRTSRAAVCSVVSPRFMPPLGSPRTRRRPRGTITTTSSPRTTTPPYDVSVDIALQRAGVVDGEAAAALRDDAGPLQDGQEATGGLARGAGELGQVGLRRRDGHVRLAGRALVARLLDELPEHGGHPALDGLEGLARQPLVRAAQPPHERHRELDGDLRVLVHQPPHVLPADGEHLQVVRGLDGGRAQLVVEHGELPEDVARPERREDDLAAVGVLAQGAGVTRPDDVAGVGRVALAEDRLACGEAARHRHRGDRLELRLAEAAERRDLPQQQCGSLGHAAGIPQPRPPRGGRGCERSPAARVHAASSARSRPRRAPQRAASQTGSTISASGIRTARAISATPAMTSSTRSASSAASPGDHTPSSSSPAGPAPASATSVTVTVANAARLFTRRTAASAVEISAATSRSRARMAAAAWSVVASSSWRRRARRSALASWSRSRAETDRAVMSSIRCERSRTAASRASSAIVASRFGSGTRRAIVPPPPLREDATLEETTKPPCASARSETCRATGSMLRGRAASVIAAERSTLRRSRPSTPGVPSPGPGGTIGSGSAVEDCGASGLTPAASSAADRAAPPPDAGAPGSPGGGP